MDLKKFTIEIVDCYPYDLTKQKGFTSVANDMLVEYIREAKNGEDKKTILYLVSNNNMCKRIIHTIKESMKIDNTNIIIYCLRKSITQVSGMSELIENFLSTNHNQGTIEIIINRHIFDSDFFGFNSFLYELNIFGIENGISKFIIGIQLRNNSWNYSQFLKSLYAIRSSKRE